MTVLVLLALLGRRDALRAAGTYERVYLDPRRNLHAVSTSGQDVTLTSWGRYFDPKHSTDGKTIGVLVLSRVRIHPREDAELAHELLIYRDRRVVRRIQADGWVRAWGFWNGGQQVAIYGGGLHFAGIYVLYDLSTGDVRGTSQDPVSDASPAWVRALVP